jgi:hypothetical protein
MERPRDRVELIERLGEAGRIVRDARRIFAELHGQMNDVEDLEWLVGMLAVHARPGTLLPPRLTPLVARCAERYVSGGGSGRFTVAVPVENCRPEEPG